MIVRVAYLFVFMAAITVCVGCQDYDSQIKQVLADYHGVDVSKIGDRGILTACGRMAIENGWDVEAELTQPYRFMIVMPALAQAKREAERAITYVTGDDAPKYCEAKLQESYKNTPAATPTPQWGVYGDFVTTHGTPAEGFRLVEPDDPTSMSVRCDGGKWDVVIAFASGNSPPYVRAESLGYQVDDGEKWILEPTDSDAVARIHVANSPEFLARLKGASRLRVIGVAHNPQGEHGPLVETVFDVRDLYNHLEGMSCSDPSQVPVGKALEFTPPSVKAGPDVGASERVSHRLGAEGAIPPGWIVQEKAEKCARYISGDGQVTAALCAAYLEDGVADSDDPLKSHARESAKEVKDFFKKTDGFEAEIGDLVYSEKYGSPMYVLDYLVHSDFGDCVEDRITLIGLGHDSSGKLYGATWRVGACQERLGWLEKIRSGLLYTFQP